MSQGRTENSPRHHAYLETGASDGPMEVCDDALVSIDGRDL
jgi:hypothetical protein